MSRLSSFSFEFRTKTTGNNAMALTDLGNMYLNNQVVVLIIIYSVGRLARSSGELMAFFASLSRYLSSPG